MLEGAFEPIVIFFGLTNSLVMFQIIINNLLRDMIEKGEIAVFINDIMITTEIEERHNDIMEKVLRRIGKNNLFVKPEKCV